MLHMYLITLALSTCISDIVVIEYIRVPYIIDSDNQISKKIWECRSAVFLSRAVWLVSNSGGALAYVNFCTYSGGDEKRRIGIVL